MFRPTPTPLLQKHFSKTAPGLGMATRASEKLTVSRCWCYRSTRPRAFNTTVKLSSQPIPATTAPTTPTHRVACTSLSAFPCARNAMRRAEITCLIFAPLAGKNYGVVEKGAIFRHVWAGSPCLTRVLRNARHLVDEISASAERPLAQREDINSGLG